MKIRLIHNDDTLKDFLRNVKIFYQMKDNDILEMFRWYDIPDCKKYKELLESDDKEVIRLAIELLIADKVDKYQIKTCRSRFLHEIWISDDLLGTL